MITKGKTTALTGLPVDENQFKSEFSIKDEKILELLAVLFDLFRPLCRKTPRRKRKSKLPLNDLNLHI
jgi:hypothetical protein